MRRIEATDLAPQFPVRNFAGLTSNFAPADYLAAVRRAIEYIYAGDVFQVNLAQRLLYPAGDDSVSLYLRLRERNPGPVCRVFRSGRFSNRQRFAGAVIASARRGSRSPADQRHSPPHGIG